MRPPRSATDLYRWAPAPFRRLLRYGCVGVGVSVFYSLLVVACVIPPLAVDPTLASVIAFVITLPAGWFAHREFSFADRPRDRFQPIRFAAATGSSFVAAVGGMYWITRVAGHSYLLGIAWNWMVIPATNFLLYLLWVFREGRIVAPSTRGRP